MQSRKKISTKIIKKLFALSGNFCALPNCKNNIIDNTGTVIGDIAHIEAESEKGLRFNKNLSIDARGAFENLILVCKNCHGSIDNPDNIKRYSVENLRRIKQEHEAKYNDTSLMQLNEKTIDYTQLVKAIYPKNVKAIFGDNCTCDEEEDVRKFIGKLQKLPSLQRSFGLAVAKRMFDNKTNYLLISVIRAAFRISRSEMQEHIEIFQEYGLGWYNQDSNNQDIFQLSGFMEDSLWGQIVEFCMKEELEPEAMFVKLDFSKLAK